MKEDLKDTMLELFIFETQELNSQLESIALDTEKSNAIETHINEVFRIVHTIKGSCAMMNYDNIAALSHSLEDVFYYIRENHPENVDYSALTDVVLKSTDFIKNEVNIIQSQSGNISLNDSSVIIKEIKGFLAILKTKSVPLNQIKNSITADKIKNNEEHPDGSCYKALIFFEDGCEMENVRAFNIVHNLENIADILAFVPGDIIENEDTSSVIRKNGFEILFRTELSSEEIGTLISNAMFLKEFTLEAKNMSEGELSPKVNQTMPENSLNHMKQSMVSVNVAKLDRLMDLIGELVISQEMVIQNKELDGISFNSFHKASRQLRKVTNEIQDSVMSIRMVPLSATFRKMTRIIRDMGKKLKKEVELEIIGEETEVDKNIVEHLADPLLHLIRNAVDHGLETAEERIKAGKTARGKITLEGRNESGEVWIIVKDDGKGLDKDRILQKAREQGLLKKSNQAPSESEIYSFLFMPGFSTNKEVTEYSGRGVGLDVVRNNIEEVGGMIQIESSPGIGTKIAIKIPLTLAIIEGMKIRVGKSIYIIPITSVKEAFKVQSSSVIRDETSKRELIMIRGNCFPILRLHEYYNIQPDVTELEDGIVVVVENDSKVLCLFADELLGNQQVVVKALPKYIQKVKGISGCTVMGDGMVSLIIDIHGLFINL